MLKSYHFFICLQALTITLFWFCSLALTPDGIVLNPCSFSYLPGFELAKLVAEEQATITTEVASTFGYLPPEYLQSGMASDKSDVYGFGVVLFELVTGKRQSDPSFSKRGLNIVSSENQLQDVVDKRCDDADDEAIEALLEIAMRCTDRIPDKRPLMQQILMWLEQEVMSPCLSELYESDKI